MRHREEGNPMVFPEIDIGRLYPRRNGADAQMTLQIFIEKDSAISKQLEAFARSFTSSDPSMVLDIQYAEGGKNEKMQALRIEHWPCMVVKRGDFSRIRYYGIPEGFEIQPLSDAISELRKNSTGLSRQTKDALANIRRRANVKVFVLPTCNFCPVMARLAYRAAIESPRITAEVIDSSMFTDWSQKHLVMGVPKVVLNDITDITGAVSEEQFVEKLRDADYALIDNIYG